MLYETLNFGEAEIVVKALNLLLANSGPCNKDAPAVVLRDRLFAATKRERRLREPVEVGILINGDDYRAKLNPESNEVEVRFRGEPVMAGEWAEVWRDERDPEDFEVKWSIQRLREYAGREQPDDDTLELLSVALRHALARR